MANDDISPATNIQPLPRGQKAGMNLELYGGRVMPATFGQVVEFAQMMCKSGLAIPKHLRDNPGACLSVIQRSMAWEMDPWAVATKTYSVNDILAYESQLIAAVIRKWAPTKERVIPYKYDGTGDTMSCSITMHHAETGEEIHYQSPKIRDISPKNSPLWKTDPQQQLGYFTIRAMARRHFPEILLGVYDREEVMAMKDITPKVSENFLEDEPTSAVGYFKSPEIKVGDTLVMADKELSVVASGKVNEVTETIVGHIETVIDGQPERIPVISDELITPAMIADNIIKSINACQTMKELNEVHRSYARDIEELPADDKKRVRKAMADRSVEVEL